MTYGSSPISEWSRATAPPPALTVSQWADATRMLPEASAARGGRWRTDTTPYLAGIMDAAIEPGIRKVALMKCHQSGGSEALNNILGYSMEHAPGPTLLVQPTALAAEAYSKERLADMIRTTPALRAVVQDKRMPGTDGRAESTLALKLFPGGFLALGGANSPNTFARWAVRLAIGDDVDRWPPVVGEEGDPADLLVNRTTTFHDGLAIFVSTPTLKGGRIDTLYRRSDQRRYHLTCPACGREDFVTWKDKAHFWVRYQDVDPETARLACPCGAAHDEPTRREMVARGRWLATRVADEPGLVGFHLPAMISTLGNVTLAGLVTKWLSAKARGREALKVFVNTDLAEAWEDEDRNIKLEPAGGFLSARERYDTVPMAASLITGAIDVQDDRFELLFVAWGARDEMWVLDHHVFSKDAADADQRFDPYDAKDWARLYVALYGGAGAPGLRFEHASGAMLPVAALCVDSGYQTAHAYRFTRYNRGAIYATKGVADLQDGHLIKYSSDREAAKVHVGVNLVLVNTGAIKQRLADRIRDGRVHFPVADWCGEEFFAQLTAEEATPIFNPAGVRVGQKWVKTRPRNEVLDLLVLNIAARQIRGTTDLGAYRAQLGLPEVPA